jgi:hypothetical protein
MATRISMSRYLTAALVAALAAGFAPTAPAQADEPGYRTHRVRPHYPRLAPRYVAPRYVEPEVAPQPVSYGCGGCAPAPVVTTCCAPAIAAPAYWGTGCSACGYGGYGGGYGGYVGYSGYGGYSGYSGYQGYVSYPGYVGYRYRVAPYRWQVRYAHWRAAHPWRR